MLFETWYTESMKIIPPCFYIKNYSYVWISDALILKQMPKNQTGFVLVLKQNKADLVLHHQN